MHIVSPPPMQAHVDQLAKAKRQARLAREKADLVAKEEAAAGGLFSTCHGCFCRTILVV